MSDDELHVLRFVATQIDPYDRLALHAGLRARLAALQHAESADDARSRLARLRDTALPER